MTIRQSIKLFAALAILAHPACTKKTADFESRQFPQEEVRIVNDIHGIPHVYAKNDGDVYFGQGYAVAGLRPSQAEIFRLRSQGRRSEVVGESRLTEDLFLRAMDFKGFAERNWPRLQKDYPEIAEAFAAYAAGFNRRYDEFRETGWPSTLQVLIDAGYEPTDWSPTDVFAIAQLLGFGLSGSPNIKLELTIIKAFLGPSVFEDLFRFQPPVPAFTIPHYLDTLNAPRPPLRAAVTHAPENASGAEPFLPKETLREAMEKVKGLAELDFGGSNNFAVAAEKMKDGIAVLESDTHEGVPIPGPYVLMHLASSREGTGTMDIIGASFAGVPSVVFGHNGKVAWAPTVGFSDITDFYWEFSDPNEPDRVLRPNGKSLPTTLRYEQFRIRQDDGSFREMTVEMRDIPGHGPILPKELLPLPAPVKLSVRWVGAELPGPTKAVRELGIARNMDDMFNALRAFMGGTIGFGMATTENRIAWSVQTKHPKRDANQTFRPWFAIPGNVGPHWEGFIPFEDLPHWIDPERGYLWSANNDPIGATWDNDPGNDGVYIGFAYALGFRGQRLDDRLSALTERGDVTMEELETLQVDRYSMFAEMLMPYFKDAVSRSTVDPALAPYTEAVFKWDYVAEYESYEATIFFTWAYQFVADMFLDDYQLLDNVSGNTLAIIGPALFHWLEKTQPILDGIDNGTIPFPSKSGTNFFDDSTTPDKIETRDELIIGALEKAVTHLKEGFAAGRNNPSGEVNADPNDLTTWHWNKMLYLRSRHTLSDVDSSWTKYDEFRGAAGNVDTINVGQFYGYQNEKLNDFFVLNNASSNRFFFRMEKEGIKAKFMVPWGNSEHPDDKHYLDLVDDYMNYKFRDFPYSDAEIAAVKASEVLLQP